MVRAEVEVILSEPLEVSVCPSLTWDSSLEEVKEVRVDSVCQESQVIINKAINSPLIEGLVLSLKEYRLCSHVFVEVHGHQFFIGCTTFILLLLFWALNIVLKIY